MRAALFHGPDRPLSVDDVATPEPGSGEILVEVAACGVCHTDLHYLDHGTPTFKEPPVILGHEVSGTVVGAGEGARRFEPGDRVLLPPLLSCGSCPACRSGRGNICHRGLMLGNSIDGGYAEYVALPEKDVAHLPEPIPLVEGAIISDALTTPYHAVVNRGKIRAGDRVTVFGCGGIGLNVVQVAVALGARVVAVDVDPGKLEWARRLGAEAVVDASAEERPGAASRELTGRGADVAFEAVGKAASQEEALASLRTGGRLVLVGYSPEAMALNAGRVMFRELEIVGSLGCRPVDFPRAIDLARTGRVEVRELVTHRFPLEEIGDAFDALRAGDPIRAVVTP